MSGMLATAALLFAAAAAGMPHCPHNACKQLPVYSSAAMLNPSSMRMLSLCLDAPA
jgi:hypothetical protein